MLICVDSVGKPLGIETNLYGYALQDPINLIDPLGLFSLNDASNYSAGFGDAITLGFTKWIREEWNQAYDLGESVVDDCSSAYTAGSFTGVGVSFALGGAGIARVGGISVKFSRFKHGGGGMAVSKDGIRRFGLDWHSFKLNGKLVNRPHYHRGKSKNQMKKHRPWQGGF